MDSLEPERDTVKIGGKEYELLSYEDFSIKENAKLRKTGTAIITAMEKLEELDEEGQIQFEESINEFLCKVVSGVPKEIVGAMNYRKRTALLMAFWRAVADRRTRETAAMKKPTGETQ